MNMIPRITIAEAGQHAGESVEIAGWLYNLRRSGKIAFPILRDGYGLMQCVAVKAALPEELFETVRNLTQESSIIVTGKVRADERAPGGFEMDLENLEVVQRVPESDPYPITPKEHGTDFLMDHRHLWLRSQRQHAIIRVRHEVIKAVRDYFDSHGFTLVDTPIFTPAACEGTTTLFQVDYFEDDKAFLTQSGQLYNEATAMAFARSIALDPPSARRNPRHGGTSPNSGWWSRRWLRHAGRREAGGGGDARLHRRARAGETGARS